MRKYLINSTVTYRVDTVEEVLELRDELQANPHGELISFSYTTKYIKSAGEIVGEYQVVKAKMEFNTEKEPEDASLDILYREVGEF